jgi:hypothetical protein
MGFAGADDLHPLEGKRAVESGKSQPRAIDGALDNPPLQTAGAGEQFELQLIGVIGVKLTDGDVGEAGFLLHKSTFKLSWTPLTCAIRPSFAMELCVGLEGQPLV